VIVPFANSEVAAAFASYSSSIRPALLKVRDLIFAVSAECDVGQIVETLKWGQPAYRPARPRTGTTVRVDAYRGGSDRFAVYFHCQTNLVSTFRELYPDQLTFEGNRAVIFAADNIVPVETLKHCLARAFTYHASQGNRSRTEA
jgi:Domain of unknown function (DU1801)